LPACVWAVRHPVAFAARFNLLVIDNRSPQEIAWRPPSVSRSTRFPWTKTTRPRSQVRRLPEPRS